MRSPTRDRQIISILIALVLHTFIVLLLGLVDLDQGSADDKRLGPVAVRFEPLPELFPPQRQPEQPEPAQPESPRTAEPLVEQAPQAEQDQAPPAASQQPSGQPASEAAPAQPAPSQSRPQTSDQQAAADEWTIPTPTGRSWEAPRTERMRTPSPQTSEQTPAAESLEGRRDTAPTPERETRSSEGSRIVYGEEEQPGESGAGRTRDQSAAAQQGEQESAPQVFSDELLQDLESVESSGSGQGAQTGQSPQNDRTSGERAGSGQRSGPAPDPSDGSSPVDFEIEGQRTRSLEGYSLPELTEAELADLPPQVVVEVSFELPPSGRPRALKTESSSGIVRVDQKVMQAVGTWKFSEAPQGAEPVNGRARIVIRAAD